MRSPIKFTLMIVFFFFMFTLLLLPHRNETRMNHKPKEVKKLAKLAKQREEEANKPKEEPKLNVPEEYMKGETIMPSLGNATAKAELGRASWKLFHTTLGRFPKRPATEEREALTSYLYLFARLYPCGECAKHFQSLLEEYPPQTSSRGAASQWGCFVHNLVNEKLGKPEFDCHTIAQAYDCGCEEEDREVDAKEKMEKLRKELEELEKEDKEEKKKNLQKMLDELEKEKAEKGKDGEKEEEDDMDDLDEEGLADKKKKEAKEGKEEKGETLEEKAKKAGVEVENAGTINGG